MGSMASLLLILVFVNVVLAAEKSFTNKLSCNLPNPACTTVTNAIRCGRIPDCIQYWNNQQYILTDQTSKQCRACKCQYSPQFAHSGLPPNPLSNLNSNLSCLVTQSCGNQLKYFSLPKNVKCDECSSMIEIIRSAKLTTSSFSRFCDIRSPDSLFCNEDFLKGVDTFIEKSEQGISSSELCAAWFEECSTSESEQLRNHLIASEHMPETPFAISPFAGKATDPQICDDCKKLINDIKTFLARKDTEDQISEYFKTQICSLIPSQLKDICESFVDSYIRTLIAQIENEIDPEQICVTSGLCKSLDFSVIIDPKTSIKASLSLRRSLCDECVQVIGKENSFLPVCSSPELDPISKTACNVLSRIQKSTFYHTILRGKTNFQKCSILGYCAGKTSFSNVVRDLYQPTEPVLNPDPEICADCEKLVTDVETMLAKNETIEQIGNKISATVCKNCPKKFQHACIDFVKVHLKSLIDLLNVHFKPKCVCTAAGLCAINSDCSNKNHLVLASKVLNVPQYSFGSDKPGCQFCTSFVTDLKKNLNNNHSISEIVEGVSELFCQKLPSPYTYHCKNRMYVLVPPLLNLLSNHLKPAEVCEASEICPVNEVAPIQLEITKRLIFMQKMVEIENQLTCGKTDCQKETEDEKVTCDECIKVLDAIREKFVDSKFDNKLKEMMINDVCPQAGFFTYECKLAVNRYWDKLVNVLKKVEPKNACGFFDLCPKLNNRNIFNSKTLFVILERLALEERQSLKNNAISGKEDIPGICQICEIVIHEILQIIGGNTTAQAIETALQEVCEVVPKYWKAECLEFVEKYGVKIIDAIISGATPKIACAAMGLCLPIESDLPMIVTQNTDPHPADAIDECTVCKLVIDYATSKVNSSSSREEIAKELEQMCSYLPEFLTSDCKSMVSQYSDVIIDAILKEYSSEKICEEIKLCLSSLSKLNRPAFHWSGIYPREHDNMECTECKFIMNLVYSQLKKNETQQEIEKVLEEVCHLLPRSLSDKCTKLVDDYLVTVIRLIELEESPEEICKYLDFCEQTAPPTDTKCDQCSSIMTTIYSKLEEQSTQEEIANVLENVCSLMPTEYALTCEKLVKDYTPKLIELLMAKETPFDICKLIGLCSSHEDHCRPANPENLCSSRTLAEECGITNYCRKMVWACQDQSLCGDKEKMKEWSALVSTLLTRKPQTDSECMQGPTHWCKSVSSAQKCGWNAYKHCYHVVWTNSQPKESAECKIEAWACSSYEHAHECGLMIKCFSPPEPASIYGIVDCSNPEDWCKTKIIQKQCGTAKYCSLRFTMPTRKTETNCLAGPEFWCRNKYTIELCGKQEFCENFVTAKEGSLALKTDILVTGKPLLGAKACSQGPSYWCQNVDTAAECNMHAWCTLKGKLSEKFKPSWVVEQETGITKKPEIKAPECYYGPKFWCKSFEVAQSCGEKALNFCQKSIWITKTTISGTETHHSKDCLKGPSYWCQNEETASSCNMTNYCSQFNWFTDADSEQLELIKPISVTPKPLAEGCDKGPLKWCASVESANKCKVVKFCQTYVWQDTSPNDTPISTSTPQLPNKCSLGPGYWCANMKSARMCKQLEYCTSYVWNKDN